MTKEGAIKLARARHIVEQKSQERHFSDEIVLNMKRGYESKIKDLETQIEKMKSQYIYVFNQLCKSREIICSMLSQYRDRKEIDYSIRECGEKLLKEGVYKND